MAIALHIALTCTVLLRTGLIRIIILLRNMWWHRMNGASGVGQHGGEEPVTVVWIADLSLGARYERVVSLRLSNKPYTT